MDGIDRRVAVSGVLAAATGLLLIYATEAGLVLSVLVPALCCRQRRRLGAFLVSLAYYGAASSVLIPAAVMFLGRDATLGLAIGLWVAASLLLAVPYGLLWCRGPAAFWRAPLAVLASVVPPLGIIGWANPLAAAGILFPGTDVWGLLAVLLLTAVSTSSVRQAAAGLTGAVLLAHLTYPGPPPVLPGWEAIDTEFGNLAAPDPLREYRAAQFIEARALDSTARVLVFPETVVPRWTQATESFWKPLLEVLRSQGRTVLIGAGVPIPGTDRYRNAVVVRGQDAGLFLQRIPVPMGMWRPLSQEGVPVDLLGPGVVRIAGQRVAILICYEQLLVWPVLSSRMSRPDVYVGVSNAYWVRQTRIPQIQAAVRQSWTRLFYRPWISATNR